MTAPASPSVSDLVAANLSLAPGQPQPLIAIGSGTIDRLASSLDASGCDAGSPFVITGSGPSAVHGRRVARLLTARGIRPSLGSDSGGSVESADLVAEQLRRNGSTLVLGVGGGRVLDVAKYAAWAAGVDYIAVPTSLAHDGIFSPVASLSQRGTRTSFGTATPRGLVLDTELVATAPAETVQAGVGDLLSNITAVLDWQLSAARRDEEYLPAVAAMALGAVDCYVSSAWAPSGDRLLGLAEGLVLSGLAMSLAGTSRPCSGAEHLVSHSLDRLLGRSARMHGHQVALGTLVALAAHGEDAVQIRELYTAADVPRRPADLGLTEELFLQALELAPSCRPDRYTVLTEISQDRPALAELMREAFVG